METVSDSLVMSEAQEAFADEERYMIGGVPT